MTELNELSVSFYRPIIFCFDAEEFYFDGIFVFATIANREGETDPTFSTSRTSAKYIDEFDLNEF